MGNLNALQPQISAKDRGTSRTAATSLGLLGVITPVLAACDGPQQPPVITAPETAKTPQVENLTFQTGKSGVVTLSGMLGKIPSTLKPPTETNHFQPLITDLQQYISEKLKGTDQNQIPFNYFNFIDAGTPLELGLIEVGKIQNETNPKDAKPLYLAAVIDNQGKTQHTLMTWEYIGNKDGINTLRLIAVDSNNNFQPIENQTLVKLTQSTRGGKISVVVEDPFRKQTTTMVIDNSPSLLSSLFSPSVAFAAGIEEVNAIIPQATRTVEVAPTIAATGAQATGVPTTVPAEKAAPTVAPTEKPTIIPQPEIKLRAKTLQVFITADQRSTNQTFTDAKNINVIGTIGDYYQVQLADGQSGFILKSQVEITNTTSLPTVNSEKLGWMTVPTSTPNEIITAGEFQITTDIKGQGNDSLLDVVFQSSTNINDWAGRQFLRMQFADNGIVNMGFFDGTQSGPEWTSKSDTRFNRPSGPITAKILNDSTYGKKVVVFDQSGKKIGELTLRGTISPQGVKLVQQNIAISPDSFVLQVPPLTTELPMTSIQKSGINLRQQPGTQTQIVGQLNSSDDLLVLGKNTTGDWIRVAVVGKDGKQAQEGWVAANLLINIQVEKLPQIASPPIIQAPANPNQAPAPKPTEEAAKPTLTQDYLKQSTLSIPFNHEYFSKFGINPISGDIVWHTKGQPVTIEIYVFKPDASNSQTPSYVFANQTDGSLNISPSASSREQIDWVGGYVVAKDSQGNIIAITGTWVN